MAAQEDGDHRHQGTLDMAYPPLILASTAAALGWGAGLLHLLACSCCART